MPLNLQMNTCVWSLNTKILKSRFLCFGAVSQNAQREMGRLGSGPYPRKAGKVLLRKGGRLRGKHMTSEGCRGIEIPWKMKHGRASSLRNQITGGNASPHTGDLTTCPKRREGNAVGVQGQHRQLPLCPEGSNWGLHEHLAGLWPLSANCLHDSSLTPKRLGTTLCQNWARCFPDGTDLDTRVSSMSAVYGRGCRSEQVWPACTSVGRGKGRARARSQIHLGLEPTPGRELPEIGEDAGVSDWAADPMEGEASESLVRSFILLQLAKCFESLFFFF